MCLIVMKINHSPKIVYIFFMAFLIDLSVCLSYDFGKNQILTVCDQRETSFAFHEIRGFQKSSEVKQ